MGFASATRGKPAPRLRRFGVAWLAMCAALGVHVMDEALTDFLSVYNPAVLALRQRLGFFPMPTFTYENWLAGLITVVVILLLLTPLAFRGARWVAGLAYPFAAIMLLNGLGHLAGSLYLGRPMPGVYSSPLLLACSLFLLASVRRRP